MKEFEQEDQVIANKIEIEHFIQLEVASLKKKKVKIINQRKFDDLVDKVCLKFDIDINDPLNAYVEDKVIEAFEKTNANLKLSHCWAGVYKKEEETK